MRPIKEVCQNSRPTWYNCLTNIKLFNAETQSPQIFASICPIEEKHMINNQKTVWLLFGSLLILMVACGPIGSDTTSNSNEEEITTAPEESPPSLLTEGEQNSVENATIIEETATVEVVVDDEEVVEETAVEITEEEAPEVADNVEFDSNGIQVGFTADGYPYRGNPDAPIVIEEFSDYQ